MLVFERDKVLMYLILTSVSIKLVISPWATGDFAVSAGKVLNYLCDGGIFAAILLGLFRLRREYLFVYVAAFASGYAYWLSTLFFTDLNPLSMLSTHLKIYLPLLSVPVLYQAYEQDREAFLTAIQRVCWLVGGLLLLGLVILPPSLNRMEVWWPTWFSGLHSTAYAALVLMYLTCALVIHQRMSARFALAVIGALTLAVFVGWGVRTATLASLVFLFGLLVIRLELHSRPVLPPLLIIGTLATVSLLPLAGISEDFDLLTSGRLSMYAAKYAQLQHNSLLQWFIGNGFGSDLIETDIWWWGARGAHSDVITMLVEGGLIYLCAFIYVVYRLSALGGWVIRCLLASVMVTTLFSNGVFVRPVAGYLLAFTLVLFIAADSKQEARA